MELEVISIKTDLNRAEVGYNSLRAHRLEGMNVLLLEGQATHRATATGFRSCMQRLACRGACTAICIPRAHYNPAAWSLASAAAAPLVFAASVLRGASLMILAGLPATTL